MYHRVALNLAPKQADIKEVLSFRSDFRYLSNIVLV
jgi:hypothetical protein